MKKKNVSHLALSDETPRMKIGRSTTAVYNALMHWIRWTVLYIIFI